MLNTVLGSLSSGVATSTSSYESIASATPSGTTTFTFSSIASTYKSLQIRYWMRGTAFDAVNMQFNSDTGANYAIHRLTGNGSTVSAGGTIGVTAIKIENAENGLNATYGTVGVCDIIDYASTTKNKTARVFVGLDTNAASGDINLRSGLWLSTAAITSITISTAGGNFGTNTQFALYGIKG